jgi:nicotinamidase-related amidase
MDNVHLLLVDPQNDFCDIDGAALPVPGANADLTRAAALIDRCGAAFSRIHVTLDSHHALDIAHPAWWHDAQGQPPAPFTVISVDDVQAGRWRASDTAQQARSQRYVKALGERGRYPLIIWPEHCLVGSHGHNVQAALLDALHRWSRRYLKTPEFVWKGLNPATEHYSALQAEVPDPDDASTLPDPAWIGQLAQADTIVVAGQALSHCVASTVRDLAYQLGDGHIGKLLLLCDCSSPVAGFEALGDRFMQEMTRQGMRSARSTQLKL